MATKIRDLGTIGDRSTCALINTSGDIVWYCPTRFDKAAVFTSLIDPEKGGYWTFDLQDKEYQNRYYIGRSAVLITEFKNFSVTDFMSLNSALKGICRIFSEAPADVEHDIFLKPYYGIALPEYEPGPENNIIHISRSYTLIASHELRIEGQHIIVTIPKGEKSWFLLTEISPDTKVTGTVLEDLQKETISGWDKIAAQIYYEGPYEMEVNNSLRAIQLMTYQENGGIIAAATTSLPEVPGGSRNYDYRYVWLRDSAMIISALIRAESSGEEERKFLSFLCDAKYRNSQKILLPLYSLDKLVAKTEELLPLDGYENSKPIRIGNNAMDQLQLDANANVLIAAKVIYNRFGNKDHWETVTSIADSLVERWEEEDHGIWEEKIKKHFTSSKVIVAKSLEFLADFAEDHEQKNRWLDAAKKIRRFVSKNCMTKAGAFATYAGSEAVDVTAALFPIWLYCDPDGEEMKKTVVRLEQEHRSGQLYHRTLELFDAKKEGVFLAGSLWMAQYYLMVNDIEKSKSIIEAALRFSNDLGFFSEEGSVDSGEMLGNFPQTFVHASFIGAILDLKGKLNSQKENNND